MTTIDVNTRASSAPGTFDTIFKTNPRSRRRPPAAPAQPAASSSSTSSTWCVGTTKSAVLAEFKKQLAATAPRSPWALRQLSLVEMTRKAPASRCRACSASPAPPARSRPGQDGAHRLLRHPARDPARGAAVLAARVPSSPCQCRRCCSTKAPTWPASLTSSAKPIMTAEPTNQTSTTTSCCQPNLCAAQVRLVRLLPGACARHAVRRSI